MDSHIEREDEGAEKASIRDWVGLAVIAFPCMLYTMDLTILNLAVPAISRDLMPTSSELLWMVDIYGFLVAGALLTMGTLGDRIGRRKLLLIGAASFGLASVVAGFSTSALMLIVARGLLGVAGATLAPSTLSLISSMFQRAEQRSLAVSIWIASFSLGGTLGPVVGGVLLESFSWRMLFFVPLPIMLVTLILGPILLPEYTNPRAGRLDLVSAALSIAAILPVIFAIKTLAESGSLLVAAGAALLGIVCGVLFARRQLRLADPLLDLRLFREFRLSVTLALNICSFFVIFGIALLTAQYVQLVLGLSPLAAGLWSLPDGLGFVLGSLLTPALRRAMRPAYVLALGMGVGAVGMLATAVGSDVGNLYVIVVGLTVFSVGLGPCVAIVADLVVSAADAERAGAASALNETSSELGGAVGIALLGSLSTYLYRATLGVTLPASLDDGSAATALRGIGAASEVARSLGTTGDALLTASRSAYADAVYWSLLSATVVLAGGAIVAYAMLGRPEGGNAGRVGPETVAAVGGQNGG